MNKSMVLTISTIITSLIFQLMATPLSNIGIEISEAQLQSIFIIPAISMIIGYLNAKSKRENKQLEQVLTLPKIEKVVMEKSHKPQSEFVTTPKLSPVNARYQTNFIRGVNGNSLPFGSNLWIRRTGVRSYINAQLFNEKMNMIQIDQSHQFDEDGDIETTRLETSSLPRGKYYLTSQGDSDSSDSTGNPKDEFYIV